jgi:hypothetical protein
VLLATLLFVFQLFLTDFAHQNLILLTFMLLMEHGCHPGAPGFGREKMPYSGFLASNRCASRNNKRILPPKGRFWD